MKGMLLFHNLNRLAQEFNVGDQQALVPIQQVDGKEIAAAGNPVTAIIGHAFSVVDFAVLSVK